MFQYYKYIKTPDNLFMKSLTFSAEVTEIYSWKKNETELATSHLAYKKKRNEKV